MNSQGEFEPQRGNKEATLFCSPLLTDTHCGITRGRVVEGRHFPLEEWLPSDQMAATHTTSPRMHCTGRCKCLSLLITAGAHALEEDKESRGREKNGRGHGERT